MDAGSGKIDLLNGAGLTTIRTVKETGSTNADLLVLASAGLDEGTWLRAERQSAGRGRQGRPWVSPAGNLHASTLVRLRFSDPPAPTLALVAAVALHGVIAGSMPDPARARLKWPNDLLIGSAKVSGILLERAGEIVVIGIGVNVAHHPDLPDRRTTSLAAAGGAIEAAELAEKLSGAFAYWLTRWREEGLGLICREWLTRAHPLGTALSVHLPDGSRAEGTFDGLEQDGALILRLASGERRVMHAADVFLL